MIQHTKYGEMSKPPMWLLVLLIMFPQIVETIYSPALGEIGQYFGVSDNLAAATIATYFYAFAIGVVAWGILSDSLGRRVSMLLGLMTYALGVFAAVFVTSFDMLLVARAVSAFGAAAGSVVTQTMLRDKFVGGELGKAFSLVGMGIAISPVIGMFAGGQLTHLGGHTYVFLALCILAVVLLSKSALLLPETRSQEARKAPLAQTAKKMLMDRHIWVSALLVAGFNVVVFNYYQIGPFIFRELGLNAQQFGYSGVVLAVGTLIGSSINKRLLSKGITSALLIKFAVGLSMLGSLGVYVTQHSLWFLLPMMIVVMAFGIGIPNVLSQALANYKQAVGSASAILGLLYYTLIALGLSASSALANLGLSLTVVSMLMVVTLCFKGDCSD
ncbi:Inner membrane transport protein YdhC [Vibrio thalassae]|uniref:Inner membrane transport protein YdhC n=1 Tax=Vibrio thalassae TaxID=1243014 RepID=A0A240EK06_9VIBR|nr:multidrug effflux MFS transporter [Vibrio thalassae]SNX48325.1 Inner membrane transport protein YdhC [Vibrio thalassae]